MPNYQTPRPSELMYPNPYVKVVDFPIVFIPEVEAAYINAFNIEQRALKAGASSEMLPIYSSGLRLVREAQMRVTDSLTGLLNREGINELFERSKPEQFGIFFADGDKFGQINKKYGHDMGDRVIGYIGQEIAHKFRAGQSDSTQKEKRSRPNDNDAVSRIARPGVGRYGGDEFLAIANFTGLTQVEQENALRVIEGRLGNFGSYTDLASGIEIPVSISAVGMLGTAKDDKPLVHYKKILDSKLKDLKASR